MNIALYEQVEEKILDLHGVKSLLDSDVAELYGVTTKQINQAVNRNQDKFPDGYIIDLSKNEKDELVTNCDRFNALKHYDSRTQGWSFFNEIQNEYDYHR